MVLPFVNELLEQGSVIPVIISSAQILLPAVITMKVQSAEAAQTILHIMSEILKTEHCLHQQHVFILSIVCLSREYLKKIIHIFVKQGLVIMSPVS